MPIPTIKSSTRCNPRKRSMVRAACSPNQNTKPRPSMARIAPIQGESIDLEQRVREARLSLGGWACEVFELRRTNRLIPHWCGGEQMVGFSSGLYCE